MDANQIGASLRVMVPAVLMLAVGAGWLSSDQSSQVGTLIINAGSALAVLGSALYAIYKSSQASHLKSVEAMPDVKVVVGPAAPPAAKDAAADKDRPNVVAQVVVDPGPPPIVAEVKPVG